MFHRQRVEGPDLSYYLKDFGKLQFAWWEVALLLLHTVLICSPRRTGRACFDKMFLLVHAWSHTRGCFLLACNLPASGGVSFPVAFQPFFYSASLDFISLAFFKIPPPPPSALTIFSQPKTFPVCLQCHWYHQLCAHVLTLLQSCPADTNPILI